SRTFVDVIAVMEDGVEVRLQRQMTIGVVPAMEVRLATRHSQADALWHHMRQWRGAYGAHGAGIGACHMEAIPVRACRGESSQFHMHAMTQLGARKFFSAAHDVLEPLVLRDFPLHLHRAHRHPAML